jgi:hypothetical protein
MRRLILYALFLICSINTNAQEKIYTLTEVDVAPKLENYKSIDSLDSKQNFKRALKGFLNRNIEFPGINRKKIKVYVEILINEVGKVSVLRIRGNSPKGKRMSKKVISKIKIMISAIKDGHNVSMKHIVPIVFNPTIIIGGKERKPTINFDLNVSKRW